MATDLKAPPSAPRFVGTSIARKEDARLLTGRGRFVDDIQLAGMLHVAFVRSTVAAGKLVSVDVTAARALPGVIAVLTAAEINPHSNPIAYTCGARASKWAVYKPLAEGDVRHVGDPIALVVAEDRYIAEDAAELVEVDYEPVDPVLDFLEAGQHRQVHPEMDSNVAYSDSSPADPELERIFETAPCVVEEIIDQQRHCPSPIETRGLIVIPGEELTIHCTTQNPHVNRSYIAQTLNIPEHSIRMICGDVGGGFGMKFYFHRDEMAVVVAARQVGHPLKWIEDRGENLVASSHARREWGKARMAFERDGTILAMDLDYRSDCGAFPLHTPELNAMNIAMFYPGPYRVPRCGMALRMNFTNTPGLVAYRGPWMFETLARELLIDRAAAHIGLDPVEFRLRNILRASELPYTSPAGAIYHGVTPGETLDQTLHLLGGLDAFRAQQAEALRQGRYLGLGASCYVEPTAMAFHVFATEMAEVRIEPSGAITATVSLTSQGQSIETTMAQVIADELGVHPNEVTVKYGDTALSGWGAGAMGSRQGVIGGGAAKRAAEGLREKILAVAAHRLQASPDELTLANSTITASGAIGRSISLQEVAMIAYSESETLPETIEPGLHSHYRYRAPPLTLSNASHLCVCEVHPDTGMVKILRWLCSEDCGVMLNPAVVEGQVAGGVIQGIGSALFEDAVYDEDGNPQAGTYKDYLLPLITDSPQIEFAHLCTPSDTPTGARGVGEGGAIVAPSAVVNAVADALAPLGVRCTRLPLSPSRIADLVAEARSSAK